MKGFGGLPQMFDLNPYEESQYQQHPLGALAVTDDGRMFRYAQAGEAITIGYLAQSPAIDTATITMAVTTAAAIGAKSITFTHGATTSAANEYAEGMLTVEYGTGIGQSLKIASHLAWTSGLTGCVVNLVDAVKVALDTTSKIGVYHNPYNGVLMDTSLVTKVAGAALRTFTSGYYGWLQTKGLCALAADNTITAGYRVMNDGNDAGKIDVSTANAYQVSEIGWSIQAGADTYSRAVWLNID